MHNAVSVYIKGNFYLGHSSGSGRDAVQHEIAQRLIICRHLALALEHMDIDRGLSVGSCGEYLALLGRYCGVPVDKTGKYAA